MSDKKRKRTTEKDGPPIKKVAVGASTATVKVSLVPEGSDELCPVLAATPGLTLPSAIPLKPYRKRLADSAAQLNASETSSYELLLHSSAHPRLDYAGQEEPDNDSERYSKHYVGVYNPQSGELKVTEAHKVVVRTTLRSEAAEVAEAATTKPTIKSLRQTLGMEFGTKKSKKAIASLTINAISPSKPGTDASAANGRPRDDLEAAVLDSMQASADSMPSRDSHQAAVDEAKPRPKADLAATTPAEVYPLTTLITEDELKVVQVKEWTDAAEKGEDINTHSRFVSKRLRSLTAAKDVKTLKILRYILILINFNATVKATRGGGRKLPMRDELKKKLGVQDVLIEGIRRKFAVGGEMTKWHVDNLMTHIGALALIIDNYEVDFFDLKDDLRLESRQMSQYFREIGCRISAPTEKERAGLKLTKAEAVQHKMARLKIPLEFPKQRVMVAKRR